MPARTLCFVGWRYNISFAFFAGRLQRDIAFRRASARCFASLRANALSCLCLPYRHRLLRAFLAWRPRGVTRLEPAVVKNEGAFNG